MLVMKSFEVLPKLKQKPVTKTIPWIVLRPKTNTDDVCWLAPTPP